MAISNKYIKLIEYTDNIDPQDKRLLIEEANDLKVYYAPFEYINKQARLVIVGLTPGEYQAKVALKTLAESIRKGLTEEDALKIAKETASFSGPMRNNLINTLNHIGVNSYLGINDCCELFETQRYLVHYTSVLRNPVFKGGNNYSGSPRILSTDILRKQVESYFYPECQSLKKAIYIPLGREVESVLKLAVEDNIITDTQVLFGMPHPSGANAERISYFLGRKKKDDLSEKTNALIIDNNRDILIRKIQTLAIA